MAGPTEGNLNSTTPAAPSGKQNCVFRADAAYLDPLTGVYERDITCYPPSAGSSLEGAIALSGDIGGSSGTPKVIGIQGIGVSATSPTNGQVLKYDSGSGLYVPATPSTGSSGPSPSSRRWAYGHTTNNSLTSTSGIWVGDSGTSGGGTIAHALPPTSRLPLTTIVTSSTINSTAGILSLMATSSTGWVQTGKNILFQTFVALGASIANVRIRIGMGAGDLMSTWLGGDTIALSFAAFRFSTSAGDTNWMCETGDGTSETATSSGIAAAASTYYLLQIQYNDAVPNIVFSINGSAVATNATHLPASATAQSFFIGIQNLAAVTKELDAAWIYQEADN